MVTDSVKMTRKSFHLMLYRHKIPHWRANQQKWMASHL
jgi:hypothetical protein